MSNQDKLVPEGVYRARAVLSREGPHRYAQLGYTGTGTEQVAVVLEITEEGDQCGRMLIWRGYFTDASWERTVESLRFLGYHGEDLVGEIEHAELGEEVRLTVTHEQSQDGERWYARAAWINALVVEARVDPMDEPGRRAFGAVMRSRLRGTGRPAKKVQFRTGPRPDRGNAPPPSPNDAPPPFDDAPPPTDDEIPF